ncbi:hypothetical protein N7492_002362 [Penicillium capsulatum]|uniref:Uncharacterized protein n=1 Tax=Penicillium capsulatum TaxID=69766 RepID=A0A9W9LWC8_9EURO|nr:hypothetical protein N7492_002362 [Penicillium capsulatum]KAJ6123032.1 hypothetical protein N7512_005497 [Penicillium capsulatum]
MRLSVSSKQAIFLLSVLSGRYIQALASPIRENLATRNDLEECADDNDPAETDDAPKGNNLPGLGVKFQTGGIVLHSDDCSPEDVASAKGKMINGHKGENWMLTADTMSDGELYAEYILNGKKIKLGKGTVKLAAEAAAKDVEVIVENNPYKWSKQEPEEQRGGASFIWQPQITAPLPLQGLNDLFGKYLTDGSSCLLSKIHQKPLIHVTKKFFQPCPNELGPDAVGERVLGFFSLVLSYTKAADPEKLIDSAVSPKELNPLMPRPDFVSIYKIVKSSIPGNPYDLVKILGSPVPTGQMDRQRFGIQSEDEEPTFLTVRDWIKSLQESAPDALTKLDQHIDGSIGGLGASFENILGSKTMVPLFELRRLRRVKTGEMADFVSKAEKEIISYHQRA